MARTRADIVASVRAFAEIWADRRTHRAAAVRRRAEVAAPMYAAAAEVADRGAGLPEVCRMLGRYERRLIGCAAAIAAMGQSGSDDWSPPDPGGSVRRQRPMSDAPTWGDCTIPDPHGRGHALRCRRQGWGELRPDGRCRELVWPVGADGANLTRAPIAIETRLGLGYPLPDAVEPFGRRSRVVIYDPAYWRPWEDDR